MVEALAASLLPSDRPPFDESWRGVGLAIVRAGFLVLEIHGLSGVFPFWKNGVDRWF